ncbi:hypothetical protein IWQ62_003709 [Dispira parvispora]|uniref:Uncharacterized protein n=1 Tax=Dispira parvispora TaxID=1520584 RepID=A0A9W8AR91_9FUNG|nr:hypothetical protein IWQ62_003709 [Dispira parvispora]
MSVATYDADYSVVLRFHGSVVPHVTPAVLFFAAWSAAVVVVDKYTVLNIGIPTTIITILALVISLLLVFRTNTAYDRYWEGRRVWSQMVLAIRNLSRLLWTVLPNELDEEKDVMLHLLHAFAVSVKCYLHDTDPFEEIHDIKVIRPTIPTLKEYYEGIRNQDSSKGWARDLSFLSQTEPEGISGASTLNHNHAAHHADSAQLWNSPPTQRTNTNFSNDSIPPTVGSSVNVGGPNHTPSTVALNDSFTQQSTTAPTKSERRHRHKSVPQLIRRTFRQGSASAEDIQANNATVPYVISLFISNYIVHATEEENIDAIHLGQVLTAINTLTECLTGFERIQRTPIPIAYAIHLHQAVLLYLLTLPFQLLKLLDWVTIPVVAIVAFTMLGILHIGKEIENPFGTDVNDLPLDDFCEVIGVEINDMTAYNPPAIKDWVSQGEKIVKEE